MRLIFVAFVIGFAINLVEPFPINTNLFESAYQWITDKIGFGKQDDQSGKLTFNLKNIDNLDHVHLTIDISKTPKLESSNNVTANKKRTNLLELAKNLNLTTFVQKAIEAGIEDVLDHEGPFTLFAPTNDAFAKRPKYCDNVALKDLIKYHVGKGSFLSSTFKNNLVIPSLLTRRGIRINIYNKVITSNGRLISQKDYTASNGVLHILDIAMCAVYKGSAALEITRCPAFSTLSQALKITDLYSSLNGSSLYTVFAPTDSAFKKLPPEILDHLMKNVTALKEVLLYHIVPDVMYSQGLVDGQTLKTLQGQKVTIEVSSDKIMVNDALVNLADATVANGVVHSIDTVLIPKMMQSLYKEKSGTGILQELENFWDSIRLSKYFVSA